VWLAREEQQRLVAVLARAMSRARTLAGGALPPAVEQMTREQAVLLTLLHTGVGISELVGLTLTDVTLVESTGNLCVRPKGRGQPARTLALNAEVRQALSAYLALRPRNRGDRLFVSQRGTLSTRQVQRILQKWASAAGISPARLTAQALRHTFGYNLAQAGVPLDQVAALLGYTNLNPLRGYVSQQATDLQQAVESIVVTGTGRSRCGGSPS
jgi:site-specific recombinase XerD